MVGSSASLAIFWAFLLSLVEALRPFDGTYTVVNKANGRRMFASPQDGLFVVDDSGPIYNDQLWLLAPQDNQSYAIINAANGLRVLAQSFAEGDKGFFAVDNGPIYQDQRWTLSAQSDGSYAIVNVKSGRRILTRAGQEGTQRFAAIASSEPIQADETWWLINQERDETARFIAELEFERVRVERLTEHAAMAKNESMQLMGRLQSALATQRKFAQATEALKSESRSTSLKLAEEQSTKAKLTKDVETHQTELLRLQSELLAERRGKEDLLQKQSAQVQQNKDSVDQSRAAQHKLSEELKLTSSEKRRLASALQAVGDAKEKLLGTVASMSSEVAMLSAQLTGASDTNLELTWRLKVLEAQPGCWIPKVNLDMGGKLFVTVLAIALAAAIAACGRWNLGLLLEVRGKKKRISALEQELHAEFGSMVCVGDSDGGLGSDFGFCVFNTEINQEAVRLIKIQCPGVKHADVEIELVFNGCEVIIRRQASRGVAGSTWTRRFQFKPSDGLFEFREEQMVLEDGFLQLVFRACAFQTRSVLFPRHFSLADTDTDTCWDYAAEGGGDDADAWWNEAPGAETASGASPGPGKPCSLIDADTESTASTARVLV